MSEDTLDDLLNSKFSTLDAAIEDIAKWFIKRHPKSTSCEVNWQVNKETGNVDFTVNMYHAEHYCQHTVSIPYLHVRHLTGDTMQQSDHGRPEHTPQRPRMEYDKPYEGAEPEPKVEDEEYDDSKPGPLDQDEDEDDDSLDDYIEDPDGEETE